MLSVVGCGNTSQLENTTVQEQQIVHPDRDRALDLANQTIGRKYSSTIGCGFTIVKDAKNGDTIQWLFVSDQFTMGTTLDDAGVVEDHEHLKNEIINDYIEILKVFEENNIDIKLIVNMETYPKGVACFSIDENGNVYDILDDNFIEDEDNWGYSN
jgi:hypothetical protein